MGKRPLDTCSRLIVRKFCGVALHVPVTPGPETSLTKKSKVWLPVFCHSQATTSRKRPLTLEILGGRPRKVQQCTEKILREPKTWNVQATSHPHRRTKGCWNPLKGRGTKLYCWNPPPPPPGQDFSTQHDQITDRQLPPLLSQAFGFLSCILFVVDMVLNYRVFQAQRAQEIPSEQGMQGLPQRKVWDINYEYLKAPVFYIKMVEMVRTLLC